jgi:hypothetical protein
MRGRDSTRGLRRTLFFGSRSLPFWVGVLCRVVLSGKHFRAGWGVRGAANRHEIPTKARNHSAKGGTRSPHTATPPVREKRSPTRTNSCPATILPCGEHRVSGDPPPRRLLDALCQRRGLAHAAAMLLEAFAFLAIPTYEASPSALHRARGLVPHRSLIKKEELHRAAACAHAPDDRPGPRAWGRERPYSGGITVDGFEGFLPVPQRLARAPRLPYAGCASPHSRTITFTSRFARIGLILPRV